MPRSNFFLGQGYLTDEQRKRPLSHISGGYIFTSCVDLSDGIKVERHSHATLLNSESLAKACAQFMGWWGVNVWHGLNGFPGFDNLNWKFADNIK